MLEPLVANSPTPTQRFTRNAVPISIEARQTALREIEASFDATGHLSAVTFETAHETTLGRSSGAGHEGMFRSIRDPIEHTESQEEQECHERDESPPPRQRRPSARLVP